MWVTAQATVPTWNLVGITQSAGTYAHHTDLVLGNGLYVGGGAGFGAVLTKMEQNTKSIDSESTHQPESAWDAKYSIPMFADVKYSFMESFATLFIDLRGGAIADISDSGASLFINPALGVDIARFSFKVGYERQLGCWGSLNNTKRDIVKLSIAYTF